MKTIYALILLASASATAAGRPAAPPQAEDATPPFTLTISASPTNPGIEDTGDKTVKAGSPVTLRIRKKNTSDHEIVRWPDNGLPFGDSFEVRDNGGNLLGPAKSNHVLPRGGGEARLAGTKDAVLQPGESKIDYAPLASWFDMSQPGTYTIQISAHITDDPKSDVVKSNIITVTVVAPQPEAAEPK
jgi:hypothetical protein